MMNGTLVFCGKNFVSRGNVSAEMIKSRFKHFFYDLVDIDTSHSERIDYSYDSEFLDISPDGTNDIYSFVSLTLDKRETDLFFRILRRSAYTSSSYNDIEAATVYSPDEKSCTALVVLNKEIYGDNAPPESKMPITSEEEMRIDKIADTDSNKEYMQFDRYCIVYGRESWIVFQRQILGNHPGSATEFMDSCKYCFPEIIFGSDCIASLDYSIEQCPRQLVYHLACMNDEYDDFVNNYPLGHQLNEMLGAFAGKYNFYKAGSKQGSQKGKEACMFDFKGCPINCEGHWKIQYADADHTKKIYVRIYFYHGKIEGDRRRLFVGSMSLHA